MVSFGILGIGFMGKGIARNVLRKGKTLNLDNIALYDPNKTQIENLLLELQGESISQPTILQTSKDILNQTDIISLSLPSEEVCENLLFGKESGIVHNLKNPDKHRIIMDHSTYSKTFVTHCAKQAKLHGNISFVDAPVSGGPQGAWDGTLSVMVGCEENVFPKILPILKLFSAKQIRFGDTGTGMAAKLINQALVGVHAQAAVEAIRMANKLDLKDTALLKDLLAASWGQSKILDLVLNDYNTVQSTSSSLAETMEKIRSTASPAPLRNLYKDFHCIEVEVSGPGTSSKSASDFPLISFTQEQISKACEKENLQNAPFVSLIHVK